MDLKQRLKTLPARLGSNISRRVHDRHLQTRLQFGSALGLGVGFLIAVLIVTDAFATFSSRLSDFLYQSPDPTQRVILVTIDDASQKQIGDLPWKRTTIAALVNAIAEAQPSVLALDWILPEPAEDDAALAQALERIPHVVQPIIGIDLTRFPKRANARQIYDTALSPAPALRTRTTTLGHAMITPDADGVVRRIPITIETTGKQYPAIGIAALTLAQNPPLNLSTLMTNDQGEMFVNFVSPSRLPTISAADILNGRADLKTLRNNIVLIGITGSAAPENFHTPLSSDRRGYTVEIQANLIETILGNHQLVEQDHLVAIIIVFLFAIMAGSTIIHFRLLTAAGLTLLYFVMYITYALDNFRAGILVQLLYLAVALLLVLAGAMIFRYFNVDRRRAAITSLARRYVAPESVDLVLASYDAGDLPLQGVRRNVTVLAIDLRELAHLEVLDPEALIHLLDQYVTLIVSVIFRHNGSVAKHTGDSITAIWNLLMDQPDHALQAVRSAVEIKQELAEFDQNQIKGTTIQIGIGIATGQVVAGPIGKSIRTEYTVVGEIVNIAERLAGKPEHRVYINEATFVAIQNVFDTYEVKPIKLRRKTDPTQVWQVLLPIELEPEPETEQLPETTQAH